MELKSTWKCFPQISEYKQRWRENVRQNLLLTVNVYLQCCIIIKDVKKHFFSGENIFSSMLKWRLLIDHLSLGNVVITMAMVIPIITKAMFITIMTKVMMFIIIMTKASVITKYWSRHGHRSRFYYHSWEAYLKVINGWSSRTECCWTIDHHLIIWSVDHFSFHPIKWSGRSDRRRLDIIRFPDPLVSWGTCLGWISQRWNVFVQAAHSSITWGACVFLVHFLLRISSSSGCFSMMFISTLSM